MKHDFVDYLDKMVGNRFLALIGKEVAQILHNRQLLVQLLVPPTVFLILFGLALNPTFENLRVGITDYSHSRSSREFIELLSQTDAFTISRYYNDQQDMQSDLAKGKLTVGLTIPPEFDRDLARQRPAQVQAVLDAVDANTASVASGYLSQLVSDYNIRRSSDHARQKGARLTTVNPNQPDDASGSATNRVTRQQGMADSIADANQQTGNSSNSSAAAPDSSNQSNHPANATRGATNLSTGSNSENPSNQASNTTRSLAVNATQGADPSLRQNQVQLQASIFYNPGLESSWFIVPGTIGILMTVLGSQAAASLVVREKEAGTIEQLMMTPASNTQVILAKICPLLLLLIFDVVIAVIISRVVFNMPFRGSFFFFISVSILYFFIGISIGILIATFAKNEQQALLITFFINPPLVLLSGGNSPIAAMPTFFQWLTYLDPMRYGSMSPSS